MVGIVIAAHRDLGAALIRAAEGIVGPMERVVDVPFHYDESPEVLQERLAGAVSAADTGSGVIVFTDMFGGTPTNMSLCLLIRGGVEVVAGVNLPMLLKAQAVRSEMPLKELTLFLRDYGARNIMVAGDVCGGEARNGRGI